MAKADYSPEAWERKKAYARAYSRKNYEENKEKVLSIMQEHRDKPENKQKMKAYNKQYHENRRTELYEWLDDYKSNLGCVQCGFSHPGALDFHHLKPADKELEISRMASCLYSKERILKEIEKCELLCSNCHRILHYNIRKGN